MELNEIKRVLEDNLNRELADGRKRNIVFWYDVRGEFQAEVDELQLMNAKILKLTANNSFQAKYILEHQDRTGNYLVYAPFGKPSAHENYLLDILKYSVEFSTDKATAIMRDLNVTNDALWDGFQKYLKFFNNKERYKLFKSYRLTAYTEELLDIAVLSVLCKLPYPDFEEVLKVLLVESVGENRTFYDNIEKFGDPSAFWNLLDKVYGYNQEPKSLDTFAIFLLVSSLSFSVAHELPPTWESLVSLKRSDMLVFLSRFMNDGDTVKSYRLLAEKVAKRLKLDEYLSKWELESYRESDLFAQFDQAIIQNILDNLLADVGEFVRYRDLVLSRRTKHWYPVYQNEYTALYWACSLLEEWKSCQATLKEDSPRELFIRYTERHYKIDQAYRRFIYSLDRIANKEAFLSLKERIENTYVHGYINSLSIVWSNSVKGLKENWGIPSLDYQWQFFDQQLQPHLSKGERVFVIVSDALRLEAAKEFADILNTERKGSTETIATQGVLPSYTKLGMAVLLPYRQITINEDYSINVDGISIEGTENRNRILAKHVEKSIAIQYKDIIDLKRDDLRKLFGGKDLVYIYHNCIDARGDHYPTEREVFDAVEETFDQLKNIVNLLVNHLTATNIYIVSDHGFIYQRGNIAQSEKTAREKVQDSYENRRFILTQKDEHIDGAMAFDMKYLLGHDTPLKCITPKGANRFEMKGAGANYVHGGALLQEIVIPVIRFKNERGKAAKEIEKVKVSLTSLTRKITNTITYLEFFQTEKIVDKRIPCRLKVYLRDEDGNRLSNEIVIIADSRSEDPNQRKFKEKLILKNMKCDKGTKYYLVLEDEEETIENIVEMIPFTIDLA
jgi:uncharacterized protein (TIGR02687 family)